MPTQRLVPRAATLRACLLPALVVLLCQATVPAEPAPPDRPADSAGDPLPRDAVLRFGTVRFRTPSTSGQLFFAGPDRLLTTSLGLVVQVFDWPGGKRLRSVLGERDPIDSLDLFPDGERILMMGTAEKGLVLRLSDGSRLAAFASPGYRTVAVAISPDGLSFCGAGSDRMLHIRSVKDGSETKVLKGPGEAILGVAWRKTGLVALDVAGRVDVRRETEEKPWLSFTGLERPQRLQVSPAGDRAAIAGEGKCVVRELAEEGRTVELPFPGEIVRAVAFSADGTRLAAGSKEGTVRAWTIEGAKELFRVSPQTGWVNDLAWSPDGKSLVCAGDDRTLHVLDASSGAERPAVDGHSDSVACLALSPDGARLATGSADTTVALWDTATGKRLDVSGRLGGTVAGLSWNADGTALLAGAGRDLVRLDVAEKKRLASRVLAKGTSAIRAVAWAPGFGVLAGGTDTRARLFTDDGKPTLEFNGHAAMIRALSLEPGGKRFASAGGDGRVAMWDLSTGQGAWLEPKLESLTSAAFSPDGTLLAVGSMNATVTIWDVKSAKVAGTIRGYDGEVSGLAWSPDGKRIAASAKGNSVRITEAPSGREVITLHGSGGRMAGVCWSADGRRIYSASEDTTGIAWELKK